MIKELPANVTVGKFIFTRDGSQIQTTLGSCVSVVLYFAKPTELAASMSHYLLDRKPDEIAPEDSDALRYGDILIMKQLKKMLLYGPKSNLRAMIFGGSMPHGNYHSKLIANIGSNNIQVAEEILEREEISVVGQDTGGQEARHVTFDPKQKKAKEQLLPEELTRTLP